METRELEYIVAAADSGSLVKAGEALGVSASAISRTINNASAYVGVPLFKRGNHLIPTAAGMKYIEGARKILSIKEQTYMMMNSIADFRKESFSAAMSPHIDSEIFRKIYRDFAAHYPQVKINIVEAYSREGAELVIQNKVSFALGLENPDFIMKNDISFIPLQKIEYIVYIADTNAIASGGAVSVNENIPKIKLAKLKDIPYIAHEARAFYTEILNKTFSEAGFVPLTVNSSGSTAISTTMTRAYNAYAIGPIDNAETGNELRYFRLDPPFCLTKGIYMKKERHITPAMSYFIRLFFEKMRLYYAHSSKLYPMELKLPEDAEDTRLPDKDEG